MVCARVAPGFLYIVFFCRFCHGRIFDPWRSIDRRVTRCIHIPLVGGNSVFCARFADAVMKQEVLRSFAGLKVNYLCPPFIWSAIHAIGNRITILTFIDVVVSVETKAKVLCSTCHRYLSHWVHGKCLARICR